VREFGTSSTCTSTFSIHLLRHIRYINKGTPRVVAELRRVDPAQPAGPRPPVDEVVAFIDGRYLCASEAFWRLYENRMHGLWPNVVRLPVHLEDDQVVHFRHDEQMNDIAAADGLLPLE
jgi:hypothetical protein